MGPWRTCPRRTETDGLGMKKEEMNRAKEWAESYCKDYERPYYSMGNAARCYLHAISEIERLQHALRYVIDHSNDPLVIATAKEALIDV